MEMGDSLDSGKKKWIFNLHLECLGYSNILVYMFCQSWHMAFRYI